MTEQRETEEALHHSLDELRQLKARLLAENRFLREEAGLEAAEVDLIGRSPALSRVLQQVGLVAVTSSTVLIGGENRDLVSGPSPVLAPPAISPIGK